MMTDQTTAMPVRGAVALFVRHYFLLHIRSPKTQAAYRSDLCQFGGSLPRGQTINAISADDIERWLNRLKNMGYAPASLRRKLATLRVFFRFLVRQDVLQCTPMANVSIDLGRSRRLTRSLPLSDVDRLLRPGRRQLPKGTNPRFRGWPQYLRLRNQTILELLFSTGLRVGELVSLTEASVSMSEGLLRVRGKGGRERLAFLVDVPLRRALGCYLRVRRSAPSRSPSLFLNCRGGSLSTQGVANLIAAAAERAGIASHVTPHMLRHTIATALLRNGADIRLVQEFLGHASIATTQRYTHVAKEHLMQTLLLVHPNIRAGRRSSVARTSQIR